MTTQLASIFDETVDVDSEIELLEVWIQQLYELNQAYAYSPLEETAERIRGLLEQIQEGVIQVRIICWRWIMPNSKPSWMLNSGLK